MTNGNGNIVRRRSQQMMVPPQARAMAAPPAAARTMAAPSPQSGWVWDGSNWVCCDGDGFPCPPVPGFPPWFDPQTNPWFPGANAGVSFGTTAPNFPIRGNFWWDGIRLWMFDGAAWVDVVDSAIKGGSGGGTGSGATHVGPSAPTTPATGQQWWNGTIMQVWDGTAWRLVGPTGTTSATILAFQFLQPANLSITPSTAGVYATTPFVSTPTVDTMSGWDPVTKRYTPTKPGYYMSQITGYTGSTAGSTYSQAILKNDPGSYTLGATPVEIVSIFDELGITTAVLTNSMGVARLNGTTDFLRHWSYSTTGVVYNSVGSPAWQVWQLP